MSLVVAGIPLLWGLFLQCTVPCATGYFLQLSLILHPACESASNWCKQKGQLAPLPPPRCCPTGGTFMTHNFQRSRMGANGATSILRASAASPICTCRMRSTGTKPQRQDRYPHATARRQLFLLQGAQSVQAVNCRSCARVVIMLCCCGFAVSGNFPKVKFQRYKSICVRMCTYRPVHMYRDVLYRYTY